MRRIYEYQEALDLEKKLGHPLDIHTIVFIRYIDGIKSYFPLYPNYYETIYKEQIAKMRKEGATEEEIWKQKEEHEYLLLVRRILKYNGDPNFLKRSEAYDDWYYPATYCGYNVPKTGIFEEFLRHAENGDY